MCVSTKPPQGALPLVFLQADPAYLDSGFLQPQWWIPEVDGVAGTTMRAGVSSPSGMCDHKILGKVRYDSST